MWPIPMAGSDGNVCCLEILCLCGTDGSELSPFVMMLWRGLAAMWHRCIDRVSAGLPCLLQGQEKQQHTFPVTVAVCTERLQAPPSQPPPGDPRSAAARDSLPPPVPAMTHAWVRASVVLCE